MRATYSVAVPFPNDCAPFKVIRRCDCDRTSIVGAAQTREAAEAKARRLNDLEERLVIDHAAQFDAAELQEEERRDNNQTACRAEAYRGRQMKDVLRTLVDLVTFVLAFLLAACLFFVPWVMH